MTENTSNTDAYKADVYSFAKTLWAVMVNSAKPFPGQYDASTEIAFKNYPLPAFAYESLEDLLVRATSFSPQQRPSASEMYSQLSEILAIQTDARKKNLMRWTASQRDALAGAQFTSVRFEGLAAVHRALHSFLRPDERCHCFLPDGGGMDISGAKLTEGEQMLGLEVDVDLGRYLYIVRPRALTVEKFPDYPELGYLVLETDDVQPLGSQQADKWREHLWQLKGNDIEYAEPDDYSPLRENFIECDRYFKKSQFVFAPAFGGYNLLDDYMGTSNELDLASLRAHVLGLLTMGTDGAIREPEIETARLQVKAPVELPRFSLRYLSATRFEELRSMDENLKTYYNNSRASGADEFGSDDFVDRMIGHQNAPLRMQAKSLLESLTDSEQHEYMTLVNVGRSAIPAQLFEEERDLRPKQNYEISYLMEKLGNGYLQRARNKFVVDIQS